MGWGELTHESRVLLRPVMQGHRVWDWGAGDLQLSRALVKLGVREVFAVDSKDIGVRRIPPKIQFIQTCFADAPLPQPDDISVVSWPPNYALPGLVERLEITELLIYLGLNDKYTTCGNEKLFQHFLRRDLLVYINCGRDVLIMLGKKLKTPRFPTPEEAAALERCSLSLR